MAVAANVTSEQTLQVGVNGPGDVLSLFVVSGIANGSLSAFSQTGNFAQQQQTFAAHVGPQLTVAQFRKAIASASITSLSISGDGAFASWEVTDVDADFDDEAGRIELTFDLRVAVQRRRDQAFRRLSRRSDFRSRSSRRSAVSGRCGRALAGERVAYFFFRLRFFCAPFLDAFFRGAFGAGAPFMVEDGWGAFCEAPFGGGGFCEAVGRWLLPRRLVRGRIAILLDAVHQELVSLHELEVACTVHKLDPRQAARSYSCTSPPSRSRRLIASVCEPVHFAVAGRPLGGARFKLR